MIRFLLALTLLASTCSAAFHSNPFTTNGPVGNPILILGDSLSTDGSIAVSGLAGYETVASGRGNSWPDFLRGTTNWYFHGPYLNIASNTASLSQVTNMFHTLGGDTFLQQNSNSTTYAFVLVGANDTINDATTFSVFTTKLANLYAGIRANGGVAVGISLWVQTNTPLAQATNLTNLVSWERTNADLFVDSMQVITNAATQTIDGTHLDGANNQILANYIASIITPTQSKFMGSVSRSDGSEHIQARTVTSDFGQFGGMSVNGFRGGGRSIGLFMQSDASTFGAVEALNDITSAYLTLFLDGSTIILRNPSATPTWGQLGFGFGGPTITMGITNTPTFAAFPGSIYTSTNGFFYVKSNTSWLKIVTSP